MILGTTLGCTGSALRGAVLGLWLFDEPGDSSSATLLRDDGPKQLGLTLGPTGRLVAGRFGRGLRPAPVAFVNSGADHGDSPVPASARFPGAKLDFGPSDWTIEGWLWLDRGAAGEGTVLAIYPAVADVEAGITLRVVPRENAFVLTAAREGTNRPPLGSRRMEAANPAGPPSHTWYMQDTTLALDARPMPAARWFHFAVIHVAAERQLRLFIDGQLAATAIVELAVSLSTDEVRLCLGSDARGERRLAGAIDELRLSDTAVYRREFPPPGSLGDGR